jgi:hypothetical protein
MTHGIASPPRRYTLPLALGLALATGAGCGPAPPANDEGQLETVRQKLGDNPEATCTLELAGVFRNGNDLWGYGGVYNCYVLTRVDLYFVEYTDGGSRLINQSEGSGEPGRGWSGSLGWSCTPDTFNHSYGLEILAGEVGTRRTIVAPLKCALPPPPAGGNPGLVRPPEPEPDPGPQPEPTSQSCGSQGFKESWEYDDCVKECGSCERKQDCGGLPCDGGYCWRCGAD